MKRFLFPEARVLILVLFGGLVTTVVSPAYSRVIHVNANANGTGSGANWVDAFTELRDALDTLSAADEV